MGLKVYSASFKVEGFEELVQVGFVKVDAGFTGSIGNTI